MPITDMPVLSALRTRMQWHQERQRVLAENIANSDTPKFKPRDLAEPNFQRAVSAASSLPMVRTSGNHFAAAGGGDSFPSSTKDGYETRPAGNAVSLEDEMQKSATNQMDFAAASSLYSRSLGLLKIAIGRR